MCIYYRHASIVVMSILIVVYGDMSKLAAGRDGETVNQMTHHLHSNMEVELAFFGASHWCNC